MPIQDVMKSNVDSCTRYKLIVFLISNPAMKKRYELNDLLSEFEERKGYFIDFLTTKSIQAAIIRLSPSQKDTQEPHSVDEIYYVIEGEWIYRDK
jgi:mannose-6-phosphate isomerase-like protein (cupin superfamily)